MWEKAVLKAPFCFVRKDTQNAVNPPTQLARGLHYHKGVFLGDCSVWWKNLALVPTLLKESSWEKLISGALERERQVKWRLKKKKRKKKERWTEKMKPWHCTSLPCWELWAGPLHWCIHTMTFPPTQPLSSPSLLSTRHTQDRTVYLREVWSAGRRSGSYAISPISHSPCASLCTLHPSHSVFVGFTDGFLCVILIPMSWRFKLLISVLYLFM